MRNTITDLQPGSSVSGSVIPGSPRSFSAETTAVLSMLTAESAGSISSWSEISGRGQFVKRELLETL